MLVFIHRTSSLCCLSPPHVWWTGSEVRLIWRSRHLYLIVCLRLFISDGATLMLILHVKLGFVLYVLPLPLTSTCSKWTFLVGCCFCVIIVSNCVVVLIKWCREILVWSVTDCLGENSKKMASQDTLNESVRVILTQAYLNTCCLLPVFKGLTSFSSTSSGPDSFSQKMPIPEPKHALLF